MKDFFENNQFAITVLTVGIIIMSVTLLFIRGGEPKKEVILGESGSAETTAQYHSAEDGIVKIIPLSLATNGEDKVVATPETVWDNAENTGSEYFTMPDQARMSNDSIGVITIPKLSLSSNVFESDDQMEDMTRGIAHFKSTSAWEGLIGLSAHNVNFNNTAGIFLNLYKLKVGDIMTYKTALGERTYTVTEVKTIHQSDWSGLGRSEDNKLVLVTCITGKPDMRLSVTATEVVSG